MSNSPARPDSQISQSPLVQCPYCSQPKFFKGQRGLQIHLGKAHKSIGSQSLLPVPGTSHNVPVSQPPSPNASPCVSVPQSPTPAVSIHVTVPQSPTPGTSHHAPGALSSVLSYHKKSFPVVKRIPRGARYSVATSLLKTIDNCVNKNDRSSWESLFLFVFNTLHVSKKEPRRSLTSKIKSNCARVGNIDAPQDSGERVSKPRDVVKVVEAKFNDGDLKGAAQILFSSDTAAPNTPETLASLLCKHPPAPLTLNYPDSPNPALPCLQVSEDAVMAAIMSFKSGSAGGLDGLTPQHLKDLLLGVPGGRNDDLLASITRLVNLMLAGRVNAEVVPTLYGANLCALRKKDGGIRPIAIGSTFRRLASKVGCRSVVKDLEAMFQPIQLGVGSKGGCEAAVHACRTFLRSNKDHVLVKVDVKNAFNSISRGALLTEVQKNVPSLYPYLWQCYNRPSDLMYGEHNIPSAVGCQQGDPLGPAIFSLAIHPIISSLSCNFNMWYLDDGSLGGESGSVLSDLACLFTKFQEVGLELNMSKCELFVNSDNENRSQVVEDFERTCPGIDIKDSSSLHLLGAPVFEESVPDFADGLIHRFSQHSDCLLQVCSHMAFFILRFCLLVPKFTYVMRCSPFWKFPQLCERIDNIIHFNIQKILNIKVDLQQFSHATLPIRFGGLGIRRVSSVALPAFLSSVHSTLPLVGKILNPSLGDFEVAYLSEAENAWSLACPSVELPTQKGVQRVWDEPLCRKVQVDLLGSANSVVGRARLLASAERESGFWLQAFPSRSCGTLLDNNSFRLAVGLRLGADVVVPHRCLCGAEVDSLGVHGLSCRRSAGRISRHASLNDVIRRAFASVGVPAALEPPGLARDDGKRPDGMTLIPWQLGRPLVWDATCVDTLAPSHLTTTSVRAGGAASAADALKRRKYAGLPNSMEFSAFAVETLGPWGPGALKLFRELKKRLVEASGDRRAGSLLGQRLGIAIQRGNVASVMGTLPQGSDLGDIWGLGY